MFGRDEMESILTKGGVSLMYTTQILRAIERDVKKKRKKKKGDDDEDTKEEKDEVNNNSAQTEDDDETSHLHSIFLSQRKVIETGCRTGSNTQGSRKKRRLFALLQHKGQPTCSSGRHQ